MRQRNFLPIFMCSSLFLSYFTITLNHVTNLVKWEQHVTLLLKHLTSSPASLTIGIEWALYILGKWLGNYILSPLSDCCKIFQQVEFSM